MKKILSLLIAAIVLLSSFSLAEDLSSLSDSELMELYHRVTEEIAERNLTAPEEADKEPQPEQAHGSPEAEPETTGETVLYYSPEGGQYYHRDRNCRLVNEKYLPLRGAFLYSELENEAYKDLQPCAVCGAPARQENRPGYMIFRDAANAAGESGALGGDIDYLAAVMEKDGKNVRMITLLDDHAKELYMAVMSAEDAGGAYQAFEAYAWSLPVSYTEEITAKPIDQAELDAQAGKTVGELIENGYFLYGSGGGIGLPTTVDLSYGLFNYEFEADASFEEYQDCQNRDDLESLKLKGGKRSGFSSLATNPDYLADGTYEPQVVPHITAEEAAAPSSVPPVEEYSRNAWPLTAEGYSALQKDIEGSFGQVYLVKGVVRQVLSRNPMRVIINTGEDGESQPVVVEYPEQPGFSWEAGCSCRIYADVSSACYILPVLTARYTFFVQDAAEDEFIAPNTVPAKEAGDFIGEWEYYRIINADGSEMNREEMLADGLVDGRPEIVITEEDILLYTASLGDVGSVKYQFVPEDGSLKILNESGDPPVLRLTDNGMLFLFMPSGLPSGDTAAYLVRRQPE